MRMHCTRAKHKNKSYRKYWDSYLYTHFHQEGCCLRRLHCFYIDSLYLFKLKLFKFKKQRKTRRICNVWHSFTATESLWTAMWGCEVMKEQINTLCERQTEQRETEWAFLQLGKLSTFLCVRCVSMCLTVNSKCSHYLVSTYVVHLSTQTFALARAEAATLLARGGWALVNG